ncbi:PREDICTED: olfactory receptor 11A1-like [Gekko japonicus]|uniref:Olfactory receptor n=1 Tax=Gekko japonicus TaxID=146911 RepID=A0ABM1JVJ3_GEKJA|nr:PREDICTED: olfactory receptor 11A1-like [Gekko japonicus]
MQIATSEQWNHTAIMEFILLGFGEAEEFQILLFLVFVVIYIFTMAGNILVITLVASDQHLHTPMYYFLGNLSFLEVCYSSTILPKMLAGFLTGDKSISVSGCFTQLFFFGCLVIVECYLLSVMSFDRYVAICKPLHYATIMNGRVIMYLVVGSWLCAAIISIIIISMVSHLSFCGPNEIDHFFCDFSPLLQLSCSDTSHVKLSALIFGSIDILPPFILTITSYVFIITAIFRISSTTGREKAFATCSSHLIVVTIFYGTLMIVYILPNTSTLSDFKKVFSVPYTVLTPMVNPLIYSLRNKEVKESLRRALDGFVCSNEKKEQNPLLLTGG